MSNEDKSFEEIVAIRRKWYSTVGSVYCKYLREQVAFNKHGFRHALTDGRDHYRGEKDALMRLNLLTLAPRVIRNAINMPNSELREATDPRNKRIGKDVTFFELQAVVKVGNPKKPKHLDVTVILRRIGTGKLHYYSIRYTKHGYKDGEH